MSTKKLDALDKLIFLASDGIWDVFTEKEIIERCTQMLPTMNVEAAAKRILNDAVHRWKDVCPHYYPIGRFSR